MTDELTEEREKLDATMELMCGHLADIKDGIEDSTIGDSVQEYAAGMMLFIEDIQHMTDAIEVDAQGDPTGEKCMRHLNRSVVHLYRQIYELSIVRELSDFGNDVTAVH